MFSIRVRIAWRSAVVMCCLLAPALAAAVGRKAPPSPPWLKPWQPPVVARDYRSPGDVHKVFLDTRDAKPLSAMRRVRPLHTVHYQQRELFVLSSEALRTVLASDYGRLIPVRDDLNLIRLRDRVVDTTATVPQVPAGLELAQRDEPQLQLVQFVGPVQPDWHSALRRVKGVEIVTYFPENAYLVWATPSAREDLASLTYVQPFVQWTGPFHPAYKLHPGFDRAFAGNVQATVQLYAHANVGPSVDGVRARSVAVLKEPRRSGVYVNLIVEVPASELEAIVRLDDVVNVEPFITPVPLCERQDQVVAGNLNAAGTGPSGPGYLAWLNGLGFTANFGFTVDVTDDGFDRGQTGAANVHPVFLDAANASRVIYVRRVNGTTISTTSANNEGGHGTLNASIIGGLNRAAAGAPDFAYHGDAAGYRFGLGVAPFASLGSSKIFNPGFTSPDYTTILDAAYADGARISSNSWGVGWGATASYDAASQEYDGLVRDARPSTSPSGGAPGNQAVAVVFAAGNNGPNASTLGDVGATAKNTISVGASEHFNATGDSDGCAMGNADADDVRQVIGFSSRGPTADGRVKPDIMAPGTHVFGAASQDASFDGSSVCGGPTNDGAPPAADAYYPADPNTTDTQAQNLYTWSSGTSHSTPAVAGGAALLRQWFLDHGHTAPSPAMTKAFLMNTATYMTGPADNLPSNNQGVGRMNLAMAFDATPRLVFDQVKTAHSNAVADATETFTVTGQVADATRPFRVTMAYSDAPGTPGAGVILNNDLDLEVQVGGNVYRGNVNFNQGTTNPAGAAAADARNTVESVFLPAGTTGPFTITVRPSQVNSDGVPNNGDTTDQDFALVVYNGQFPPRNPVDIMLVLDVSGSMTEIAPGGTARKIDLLKDAVEMFVRTWEPFSIPQDRLGIVYFSSAIAGTFPAAPASPLLLPFQANADAFINNVRAQNAGGCTALGGGILTGLRGFDALPNRQRHIVVFTNGMQNRSPLVTTTSPRQIVADAAAICGDSGVTDNSGVNLADYAVKAIHTIGTGAFGAQWTTLLAGIASETGGLNHVTATPDEDLEDFFLEDLVAALRVDPVEKVATRPGSIASGQADKVETFEINGSARSATFALSWRGERRSGALDFAIVAPDGTTVPANLVRVKSGPFYRIESVSFPLDPRRPVPHAGTWKVVLQPHIATAKVDYRIHLIVDETDIRYRFEVPTEARGVGEPIPISLSVQQGTRTLTGLGTVRAVVFRPPVGFGTFLATHPVSPDDLAKPVPPGGDQFPNLAVRKEQVLLHDAALRKSLEPIEDAIELYDDGLPEHGDGAANDGVYSALYSNTQRPGVYRISTAFQGAGPTLGSLTRSEVRSVSVGMKHFDPGRSTIDVRQVAAATGAAYQVTVRLVDAFDNLLGPGQDVLVVVSPPGKKWGHEGRRVALADRLDGSYSGKVELTPQEVQAGQELLLVTGGDTFGKVEPRAVAGRWAASFHAGSAIPLGSTNTSYDPGPSLALDVEYRIAPRLFAVGVVEWNQLRGASPSTPDNAWWSFSGKLKYELAPSTWRPYVIAGAGAYLPEHGSTSFGLDAGVGLEWFWRQNWVLAVSADDHVVFTSGSPTQFLSVQLGLIYRW